ncbi:hypothetical protein [Allokutzneria albata]|uniref:Alpha amylase inhibitor n=1 Tax=Allokutzneria albata TaxID=211114 RepID=A0A1G9ZCY0_ALLAB|nr:hypothetical protein [Allokutzneria albata]SDN18446.1 hypothetical protein SAMN04489726_5385 [Allokutzneria albata]
MRKVSRVFAAVVLAVGVAVLSSVSASAEAKMHRGESGCFTYSYKQGGVQMNTTVYYHNKCKGSATITIVPQKSGLICSPEKIRVKGGDYGDYTMWCDSVRRVEGTWS